MFDWIAFCRGNNIPFVSEGPNVARNDVNIRCPWCGDDDPSEHMGLSRDPHRPWFGCWRNTQHRGSNPARLVARLLGCTDDAARAIVEAGDVTKIDRYVDIASRLRRRDDDDPKRVPASSPPKRKPSLDMPREFKTITKRGVGRTFFEYLRDDRGFDRVAELVEYYDLRYCMTGHFRYRIIVPVFDVHGALVGWTGRDVTGRSAVRYRTLSDDPEKAEMQGYPPAPVNLKSTVLNADLCRGGQTLFICEGPFDALKLDWYADDSNASAVFGMPEPQQLALLCRLARAYEGVAVVLDRDAKARAVEFVEALRTLAAPVPVQWRQLPLGVKDPAQLEPKQARYFSSERACNYPRGAVSMPAHHSRSGVVTRGGKIHVD